MKHHPAAFINAIAEEGTKEEAVQYLQKIWNENCELRTALEECVELIENDGCGGNEFCQRMRALYEQTGTNPAYQRTLTPEESAEAARKGIRGFGEP